MIFLFYFRTRFIIHCFLVTDSLIQKEERVLPISVKKEDKQTLMLKMSKENIISASLNSETNY